jgi:glycosyltransferase involved in cell wall biosynthesis
MNILLLANKLPYPARDGGSLATLNMASGLAGCGCTVTLLAVNTSKHYFPAEQIPASITAKIRFRTALADTRIKPFRLLRNLLFSRYPYNAERFISETILTMLGQILDEQTFDVIQLEGPYLFYCLPLIRKKSKALISLRAHNIEHELWMRNALNSRNFFTRRYFRLLSGRLHKLETDLLEWVDALVPISGRDASVFASSGVRCPVYTATFGLNVSDYPITEPPPVFSLFFLGALDWRPNAEGLEWFIKHAWPLIKARFPETRFYIAGRNAGKYYRKKSRDKNIVLAGEVDNASRFMSEHPVMIVPLLAGSGIRVKILEGMAMCRVVITTNTGLEGINARDGQEVLIANDPDTFVSAISKLESDPELLLTIGSNARKFVIENFDNLAVCQGLVNFYKEQSRWSGKSSSG